MSTHVRRLAAPVSLLLLGLAAGGCSSDDQNDAPAPESSPTSSKEPAPREVRTQVTLSHVPGKLPGDDRKRVVHNVGAVVDHWFEKAYLGGKYPRHDFRDAYPGFTTAAQADARRDKALMSNQPLGPRIDGVTATQRLVWIDVLPAGGRAAAATARFRLGFTTTGKAERSVVVRGRLFLTPVPHGWKVFGYDVAKGTPAELKAPQEHTKDGGKNGKHGSGGHDSTKSGSKHDHHGHDKKGGGR